MHTNSYTGPRLLKILLSKQWLLYKHSFTRTLKTITQKFQVTIFSDVTDHMAEWDEFVPLCYIQSLPNGAMSSKIPITNVCGYGLDLSALYDQVTGIIIGIFDSPPDKPMQEQCDLVAFELKRWILFETFTQIVVSCC